MGRVYIGKSPMFFQSYSHSGKAFIRGYWGESRSFLRFGIGSEYERGTPHRIDGYLVGRISRGKVPGRDDDFGDAEERANAGCGGKES